MKKKIILILAIIFLSFIFYIFYKSLYKKNYYVPQNISEKIISFKAKNLYTNNYLNSDQLLLDKKFTVINIWASWCLPCIQEHKYLMKLKQNNNIKIIGLNYKDKKNNAKKFLSENGNPYDLILTDEEGVLSIELGAYGIPETFVIKGKKILKKYIGPLSQTYIVEIEKLISK